MKKGGHRVLKVTLTIFAGLVLVLSLALNLFFKHNLTYDDALMKKVTEAGFKETIAVFGDGVAINFAEGPDNGPPLLLIHGQGMSWADYDSVLPELSENFHVFSVDVFGHGKSLHDKRFYKLNMNGEFLAKFIREVIGEPTYISGHSSGAIIAAWIASEYPGIIKTLVLEDPPLFRVTPEEAQEGNKTFAWYEAYVKAHEFLQQDKQKDYTLYSFENSYFLEQLGGLRNGIVKSAYEYREKNPGGPIKIAWLPASWFRSMLYMDKFDPEFGNTFYTGEWFENVDQEEMLKNIKVPTIYLKASTAYGKDGTLFAANTEEDAEKVIALLENAKRVDVESGHSIHFEKPKLFVDIFKELLQGND